MRCSAASYEEVKLGRAAKRPPGRVRTADKMNGTTGSMINDAGARSAFCHCLSSRWFVELSWDAEGCVESSRINTTSSANVRDRAAICNILLLSMHRFCTYLPCRPDVYGHVAIVDCMMLIKWCKLSWLGATCSKQGR